MALLTVTFVLMVAVVGCTLGHGAALMQQQGSWTPAYATFYGDDTAQATMGGACGYGNLWQSGYGDRTTALSSVLFKSGSACGQCFQIRCRDSKWCNAGSSITTVTATNLCPPNWAEPSDDGGWCNPPREHFDMSKPAFQKIANWKAGIVPVLYRRVACQVHGGIKFHVEGNAWWLLVYVMNVAGSGDVGAMWMKGTHTDWMAMSHNWGASYQVFQQQQQHLQNQALSFKISTFTTHDTLVADNVLPANWQFGATYQATVNFL